MRWVHLAADVLQINAFYIKRQRRSALLAISKKSRLGPSLLTGFRWFSVYPLGVYCNMWLHWAILSHILYWSHIIWNFRCSHVELYRLRLNHFCRLSANTRCLSLENYFEWFYPSEHCVTQISCIQCHIFKHSFITTVAFTAEEWWLLRRSEGLRQFGILVYFVCLS